MRGETRAAWIARRGLATAFGRWVWLARPAVQGRGERRPWPERCDLKTLTGRWASD
jgi:hypothetical protein